MITNAIRDAIAAGSPDVKVNAMNWPNISASGDPTPMQQLTGIDSAVEFGVTPSAMGAWVVVNVYIGTSSSIVSATSFGAALGVQSKFRLMPGMWLAVEVDDGGNGASGTIAITNITDGNLLLDTINVSITP